MFRIAPPLLLALALVAGCSAEGSAPHELRAAIADSLAMLRVEGTAPLSPEQATRIERIRTQPHVVDLQLARFEEPTANAIAIATAVTIPLDSVRIGGSRGMR